MTLVQTVLDVDGVKQVHVWQNGDFMHALVSAVGIEFDCHETRDGWLANDDDGRDFTAPTLPEALRLAIDAQVIA